MASASMIQFEYERAIRQAERLEQLAQSIQSGVATDLEATMDELQIGWRGETATEYITKGFELKNKIERVSNDLVKAADTIRRVAKRIRDAELAALAILRSKRY